MMNGARNGRDSLYGSINHHRRTNTFNNHPNGVSTNSNHDDNTLDLFSNNRRSLSLPSSDDSSDVSVKLGRLSVGGAKPARNGIEDMMASVEGGKHDYDWLLTPPGTPVFPPSENESQSTLAPPRRSLSRSTSTTKASRLSVSQSESNNHSRPARSSSVTRPSISTSHSQYNNNYSSNRSSSTNILNTSSASVSSYIRPSSPITRSTSSTRPSTPTSRTTPSRASTPSRIRTVSTSSTAEKPRPISQSSRPSTPSSRPQVPANLHSPSAPSTRSLSRPSTPTRRNSIPSLSPSSATSSSTSTGRVPLNGRSSAPSSRPSSPSPRIRAPPQPVVPPDFPLDTPPNLRTTLPDRPVSAGRSRPGVNTLKGNTSETQASVNMPRRASSPIVSRGRSTEPVSKSRGFANGNGHHADVHEPRKVSHAPEVAARRSVKASTNTTDNSGFGRNISKKSLDMAIKHMDIRNGSGNHRALSSTTLFPQSIRNSTPKSQYNRGSSAPPTSIEGGKRVAISGSGNVAQYAALKVIELGGTVVSLSDSRGALIAKEGSFTPEQIHNIAALKIKHQALTTFEHEGQFTWIEGARPWVHVGKVDIALPCATQNEVSPEEAQALVEAGAFIVAEGSNMGCTAAAIDVFEAHRKANGAQAIWYAPGKASNCGGVAVSGLEMAQNSQRIQWTSEQVDERLKLIMKDAFFAGLETAQKYVEAKEGELPSLIAGSNIAGFIKVAEAMHDQGDWF